MTWTDNCATMKEIAWRPPRPLRSHVSRDAIRLLTLQLSPQHIHPNLTKYIAVHLSHTSHRTVIDTEHLFGASDRDTIVVRHIFQGEE